MASAAPNRHATRSRPAPVMVRLDRTIPWNHPP